MTDVAGLVAERYTLPLVREIAYGYRRFSDLATLTGAPRTVLTGRLRKLEDAGVVERRPYSVHPPRHEYHLTASGRDLLPVLLALKEWGERHAREQPTAVFEHRCGEVLHPVTVCRSCRTEVVPGDFTVVGGTHPPTLRR